jgi:N-acetylornithine carbamoyltransferase
MPQVMEKAEQAAAEGGGSVSSTDDMDAAFEGADVVYPKSWGSLELFRDESAALAASRRYQDWICDARRMTLAKPDALYMHCLPADRGNEVTDEVIDGPRSVVYDEAENRLHTGKALMALTMGGFA